MIKCFNSITFNTALSEDRSIHSLYSLRSPLIKFRVYLIAFFLTLYMVEEAKSSSNTPDTSQSSDVITSTNTESDSCDSANTSDKYLNNHLYVDSVSLDSLFIEDTSDNQTENKSDSVKLDITPSGAVKWGQKRRVENDGRYPGIIEEQDRIANQMIHEIYSFNWEEADKIALKMQKLENRENLPPLSYLLMVSMRVVRIQNSEFENENEENMLIEESEELAQAGMVRSNPSRAPSKSKSTYLFIYGGIKGFYATLKIGRNPVEAAIEGYSALKMLERLIELDPQIKDVYMGLGIFYCALAKAPSIVRGALNMVGKNITFEKGIEYLQISAYEGKYTTETAKQYLIQFLSPYLGHEVAEKNKIFRSLQQDYPKNPYYLFLEINENICFHPGKVDKDLLQRARKRLSKFKTDDFSKKRYVTLVQYQYCFLDSLSSISPDTAVDLREFSFYPYFLEALKEKDNPEIKKRERYKRVNWSKNGAHAAKLLDESSMSLNRKNFFAWYVRDALRIDGSK